jgi:guanosine-3',5'-bis(diphosphate) 3'-pyrophosphohydrolase
MTHPVSQITRALHFAAQRHSSQRRKGAASEPYINHCIEVAHLLAEATAGTDTAVVVAAILHDTVEDTDTTQSEIEQQFGADIAGLVAEVTDDKSLAKAERKRLQIEKTPQKSDRAKMIKLADKTSNLRSMATSPPANWDDARKREYFEWARQVVAGCRGVNEGLEAGFDEAYRAGV